MTTPTLKITPEVAKADGQGRVASTGVQAGGAAALVTVGEWLAQQFGWDGSLPTAVAASTILLLTIAASWFKNRAKLRGETGQASILGIVLAIIIAALILKACGAY